MPTEDNHITLMDGLARGLTVYKACVDINKQLFGEDGPDITFDNKDDMIDQAIDNYVNELWDFEIVSILYNYGLEKAIQSYKYESAVIDTIKGVVFHIIREHLPETDGYVNE